MPRKSQLPKISIYQKEGVPFSIHANRAMQRHLKRECADWSEREGVIRETLESYGFCLTDGDHVAVGLTNAPVICDDWPEGRELPEGTRVWYFNRYALDDFTETLMNNGFVEFDWGFVVEYDTENA